MNFLNDWYAGMAKGQKIFVYAICTGLILVYGMGFIPLALLVYLELGVRGRSSASRAP